MRLQLAAGKPRGSRSIRSRRSSPFARSHVILSNIVAPGTSRTPPTMTRPGSPAACASTAWIIRAERIDSATALGVGELARNVSSRVAIRNVPPPIVQLLAPRQRQLHLRLPATADVQPE